MSAHFPNQRRLLIAAGGSGGHLFPAQKIAKSLKERGIEVWFAGAGLDKSPFFNRPAFDFCDIDSPPLSCSPKTLMKNIFKLFKGVRAANRFLKGNRFDAILGFGSFHTVSILIAGLWRRIPLLLHEANARPGKTVSLFAPFAQRVAVQFQNLLQGKWRDKAVLTQMPVASSNPLDGANRSSSLSYFGFHQDLPTLFIFGGSQGSAFINQSLPRALQLLSPCQFQVLHLAGQDLDCSEIEKSYHRAAIVACVRPFEGQIERAWAIADAVICRAGSSTLAEIQRFCIPALLIPYPGAGEHQLDNARQMIRQSGGAIVICQKDATPARISALIKDLLFCNKTLTEQMRSALSHANQMPKPQNLADWIYDYLLSAPR